MNVLVTGTEGYIGSVLAPMLMRRGHHVVGVDTGYFTVGWLYHETELTPATLHQDVRRIRAEDLEGVEAVVHLAELSNDPVGQLSPSITHEINCKASVRLATLAKAAGARRFVYTSSCSVYGVATEDEITEDSPLNPQTPYAVCKTLVEQAVQALAGDDFSPTFLRNATAFGASPRMRFDLVLNNLAGLAWTAKEIRMTSDGTLWRPLVHVNDICEAIVCALEAPRGSVHNQVFNVGGAAQNYRVREVAEIIAGVFGVDRLVFGQNGADRRSYRVSFEKINRELPGFRCAWDASAGARQLRDLFAHVDLDEELFTFRGFTRLKQLEHLIRTRQIDDEFFWRDRAGGGAAAGAATPVSPVLMVNSEMRA